MKPLKHAVDRCCDLLVGLAPDRFLNSLRKHHFEHVAREFNRAWLFNWEQVRLPTKAEQFEDLASLFGLTPLGRGLIRQDFDEAAALFRTVRSIAAPRGLEIGRFNGGSTLLLAVAVGPWGRVVSIDIAPQDDTTLDCVLRQAGVRQRVELIVGDANQVKREEDLDFVFIDGDHSFEGARRDHNRWGRRVRSGGYIIHHDMAKGRQLATQWSDLARLRSEILTRQCESLVLVEEAGSMAIFQKRDEAWVDV